MSSKYERTDLGKRSYKLTTKLDMNWNSPFWSLIELPHHALDIIPSNRMSTLSLSFFPIIYYDASYPFKVCFFRQNQSNETVRWIRCNWKHRAYVLWVWQYEHKPCPNRFHSWDLNYSCTFSLLQVWYKILKLQNKWAN